MVEEIKKICYKNGKFIPKRGLEWIRKNYPDLYMRIVNTGLVDVVGSSIQKIVLMIENGYDKLPLCKVCKTNNVIFYRGKLLDVCSNACRIRSAEVQEKTKNTCYKKYGSRFKPTKKEYEFGEHYLQKKLKNLEDISNQILVKSLLEKGWVYVAKHFGLTEKSHSSTYNFLRRFGYDPLEFKSSSFPEREIGELLSEHGICFEKTKRVIAPYELDIFIESHKLAIEYNGLYWHSSDILTGMCDYHLTKTNMCDRLGIDLFHVFEHEWLDDVKKSVWISIIKRRLGLCKILSIHDCTVQCYNDVTDFIKTNSLQLNEFDKTSCLWYNSELVSVITFKDDLITNVVFKNGFYIKDWHSVVGKGFVYHADKRYECWMMGGFDKVDVIEPACYVYKHGDMKSVELFSKSYHNRDILNPSNGSYRFLYDCGKDIYIKR